MALGITDPVLPLPVVLVGRFAEDGGSVGFGVLEMGVDVRDVDHDAAGGRAGLTGCGETAGRRVKPDPVLSDADLSVHDLTVTAFDQAAGREAKYVDQEVMTGSNVLVRNDRDKGSQRVPHVINVEPARDSRAAYGGTVAEANSGATAAAGAAGVVLLTLAAGQFLMTLDSSVMNVAIATVAEDVGTTITGIQTAITL